MRRAATRLPTGMATSFGWISAADDATRRTQRQRPPADMAAALRCVAIVERVVMSVGRSVQLRHGEFHGHRVDVDHPFVHRAHHLGRRARRTA